MSTGDASLALIHAEFEAELAAIARWWTQHALDTDHGGTYGEVADDNTPAKGADKGAILQSRVLWFFSELARVQPEARLGDLASAQYRYLVERFTDRRYGGLVWSIDAQGRWTDDRKQVYVQAFAIYAFCAYASAFGEHEALERAVDLARLMEQRAYDQQRQGYVEAFARDWRPIDDVRLSERDLNAPKTMNTHLHVLEACTALHRASGSEFTWGLLARNVEEFLEHFVRPRPDHLMLFYTLDWQARCVDESYGHDIEASWLLCEAVDALGDPVFADEARSAAVTLARAALRTALDDEGGLAYERSAGASEPVRERHWWPQAEALVGFYNAYQLTGEAQFREAAGRVWRFVKTHQIDRAHGEWRWLSGADAPARGPYKAGFWKGPYHNGRAMMEMMRRLTPP